MPAMPDAFVGVDVQAGVCFFAPKMRALRAGDLDFCAGLASEVDAEVCETSHAAPSGTALWLPMLLVTLLLVTNLIFFRKLTSRNHVWLQSFM